MHTSGESANLRQAADSDSDSDQRLDIPADTLSARLVLARHHAGRLSIEQAAARCGLNSGNWVRWEDGARPRDRVEVCEAVSQGLRLDLNWLIFGGPLTPARGRPTKRAGLDTDE